MRAEPSISELEPREGYVPTSGGARLFYRQIGEGLPLIVLHGGPDFDHAYLVPEMDVLASSFRLIYYDQRGRGRSAEGVQPEDVSLLSELDDLERVRRHFELDSVVVLGHSWGGVLAMEYATRYPERVSHLILMNTAPASHDDAEDLRQRLRQSRAPGDVERMQKLTSSVEYQQGDLDAEAEYYRIHFRVAFRQAHLLDQVVARLRRNFTADSVVLARMIEERLYGQTWSSTGYDLTPRLRQLDMPALVLHGAHDFIPVELAGHIAEAVPGAVLHVFPESGHFPYLEQPDEIRVQVTEFFATH